MLRAGGETTGGEAAGRGAGEGAAKESQDTLQTMCCRQITGIIVWALFR